MFVSRSMTHNVITVTAETSVMKAHKIMAENRFRHLPVVDDSNHLIGMVTDRDIRSALPVKLFQNILSQNDVDRIAKLTIGEIMTRDPFTVSPTDTIQDVLLLLQEKVVGAFPVVDQQGVLMGIISVRDLLRAFTEVLGIGMPGSLLCIVAEEKVGQLKRIVDAITEENISFGSVLVARHWKPNKRVVFPYLLTSNIAGIKRKLKNLGFELLEPLDWNIDPFHPDAQED